MAILEILTYPNPTLRKKSKEISPSDFQKAEIKAFTKSMLETMYHSRGIGLAAPQVGRLQRIVVMDTRAAYDKETPLEDPELRRYKVSAMTDLEKKMEQPLVLISPKVLEKKGKVSFQEGCLSVPSYFEKVERASWIRFEYFNLKGEKQICEVDGLIAICVQHEIDHLDGKLFIDRLSTVKSQRIKNAIKKYGYETESNSNENS